MKNINILITKIGKKTATKNTEFVCRSFLHQPKTPAKLLAIKKEK